MQTNAYCAGAPAKVDPDNLHQTRRPSWPRNVNSNPNNTNSNVNNDNPNNENDNRGVRRLIRVYKLWTDFSQPPSIRPISANFAWIWNIFVSFAMANSRSKRSFRVEISSLLLALIKYPALSVFGAFLAMISSSRHSTIEFSKLVPRPCLLRFVMWIFMSIMFL